MPARPISPAHNVTARGAEQLGPRAIMLFTDYGYSGPYVGQLKARLLTAGGAALPVLDLMHDAPVWRPDRAAYLLSAVLPYLPVDSVVLAVVDPGVGSERAALALEVHGRWLVGPDNGLLAIAARQRTPRRWYRLAPPDDGIAATFHGRDHLSDVAAALAFGKPPPGGAIPESAVIGTDWPMDRDEIIYSDGFGNLLTGRRAATLPAGAVLQVGRHRLAAARTFSAVPAGTAFWYGNSMGLVEVAANCARADELLGVELGEPCVWEVHSPSPSPPDSVA